MRVQWRVRVEDAASDPPIKTAFVRLTFPAATVNLGLRPGLIPDHILFIMAILAPGVSRQRDTIVLFGGQGSPSLFSGSAVAAAENNSRTSLSATILALRCHTASLEAYDSLHAKERQVLGNDIQQFQHLSRLLKPCPEYHRNGVVQSTTICLYQLIQYVTDLERSSQGNGHLADQILETTGFCSGLIPAAVVAGSNLCRHY